MVIHDITRWVDLCFFLLIVNLFLNQIFAWPYILCWSSEKMCPFQTFQRRIDLERLLLLLQELAKWQKSSHNSALLTKPAGRFIWETRAAMTIRVWLTMHEKQNKTNKKPNKEIRTNTSRKITSLCSEQVDDH